MKFTIYRRSEGAICYEGHLPIDPAALETFVRGAMASGLKWFWASARTKPLPEDSLYKHLPEERPLTPLEAKTASSFIADHSERNVDGYLRFIFLLAVSAANVSRISSPEGLSAALEAFAAQKPGPLYVVLVQLGDSAGLLFVPPHFAQEDVETAGLFRIPNAQIAKTRKYDRLRLARLEVLRKSLVAAAFPKSPVE